MLGLAAGEQFEFRFEAKPPVRVGMKQSFETQRSTIQRIVTVHLLSIRMHLRTNPLASRSLRALT